METNKYFLNEVIIVVERIHKNSKTNITQCDQIISLQSTDTF